MINKKILISAAVGSAFAATLGVAPAALAAENPFALQSMDKGYMVAEHHEGKAKTMKEGMCGMSMADANKDGKISQEEFTAHHTAMFTQMDTNKDGSIDKAEMTKAMAAMKAMEGKCGMKK